MLRAVGTAASYRPGARSSRRSSGSSSPSRSATSRCTHPCRRARVADGADGLRAGDQPHPRRRGVVPIYTRTPATMAQTAATIDELSGGRLTLGWASPTARSSRAGTDRRSTAPSRRCASTPSIVGRSCAARTRRAGEKWQTGFHLLGIDTRPALPIYIAAPLPRDAAPRRRDRRRGDPVALQPPLHPRRRDPRYAPGANGPA